jgi:NAD-dependent aldehyde dehydrogenases
VSTHDETTAGIEFDAWVDGERYTAAEETSVLDPVLDESIVTVPQLSAEDVDTAVDSAREAFDREWEATINTDRSARKAFDREWEATINTDRSARKAFDRQWEATTTGDRSARLFE